MSWTWECDPSEEEVVGGAPPAFVVEVEKRAGELVRAAEALYLNGTTYQEMSPGSSDQFVPGGMFRYLVVPRHERVYIVQTTPW
ncbi:hypothetical protein [Streptomyces sp. NPDC059874]|uniref:hypothetical protein n=1 Tax=Streptomyces sp. NPDC059874 TaxID=3346983 RepID=UPI00365F02B8